jgi:hypothetical protein
MKPVIVTKELISVGLPVMRGKDWIYSDQDGGAGKKGKVIAIDKQDLPGWCDVQWESGAMYCYRIGDGGSHDLYVYAPGYYDLPTPQSQKVRLTLANGYIGARVELREDATDFARYRIGTTKDLFIEKIDSLGVQIKGIVGVMKLDSFNICTDQTVKASYIDPGASKFAYDLPKPDPSAYATHMAKPSEKPVYKFRKGEAVYMNVTKHDSWTRYSLIKDHTPYTVEETNGKTMKLVGITHWQLQDQFLSPNDWYEACKSSLYTQTKLTTTPMIDMRDLQHGVVAIAENSKPNTNGTNTVNTDYSGRALELPSITISLERGERIEGTRLHS